MSVPDALTAAPFTVPPEVCRDFERASRLEWLDTNHTGAYAMGTVAGVNTRRYHSLLIASLSSPADRYSTLSRVEEHVTLDGKKFELATVQYPGAVQPHGLDLLDGFRLDPFPKWRFQIGPAVLEKIVCLLDRQQTVLVHYQTTRACRFSVRFFLSFRDHHSLTRQNTALQNAIKEEQTRLTFTPYQSLPPLMILHSGGTFTRDGIWFHNHEYLRELERGLDFREDLFSPGLVSFDLYPAQPAWLIATLDRHRFPAALGYPDIELILARETRRRQFDASTPLESTLCRAIDQFRVIRSNGLPSLIAGYPWFTDWSRDTLISLPALSIAGFPADENKKIMTMLLSERSHGLLPNRFSDRNSTPEYNTADATLWLFIAARDYLARTKDWDFLRDSLYPAAVDILDWHHRGTEYGIRVDPADHLLSCGDSHTQLTWMDAKVGDLPVTPRNGKPVEINALWYNTLRIFSQWAETLGRVSDCEQYKNEAQAVLDSFQTRFWNRQRGCLYDVVGPCSADPRIRPNQLFALSLPFPMLDRERARLVVGCVHNHLLARVGLRTLEPQDPAYRSHYEGGVPQRDGAYHQGTVWPWLIGPFVTAYLYAYSESEQALSFCRSIPNQFERELGVYCLGSLSELYDAEPPHRPGGCPSQLWSVAQLLIAFDRLAKKPDSGVRF
jgi:predicted glycogen debranching enzyme